MRYRYDKDKDEYVEDEWQGTILEACEWLVLALKEESARFLIKLIFLICLK